MKHEDINHSSQLFDSIQYCTRCCMPETQEGVTFDEFGVCTACRSSEEKMHIQWGEREKQLRKILSEAREKSGDGYDCILPISGGKDSFYQAHVLTKIYKMKPLAVTFSHNWFSETGFYNLQLCLETFGLDHIQYTPSRNLVNKLARKSIEVIGDTCWHCHSGVGAFPIQIATRFKIPLLIWGESISENDGRATYKNQNVTFDRDYFTKISARLSADEMGVGEITKKDIYPFQLPSYKEIEDVGVWGIHLGDYLFWDEERQTEFIRDHYGWRETEIEGAYKGYKSAECIMAGMHDYTCYLKRGFGRSSWQASVDVRNGLLTREEGFDLIKDYDQVTPEALKYYLEITGLTEDEFEEVIATHRHEKIKEFEIPRKKRSRNNLEKTRPFVLQIIEKFRNKTDSRIK